MTLHTETVTPEMRAVARDLRDTLDSSWYLAGGTALALRIGHRKSIDLDYFIPDSFDTIVLKAQLGECFPGAIITFEEKDTLWAEINGVKTSFISRHERLLDEPTRVEEFPLAGMRDITVMKLNALCGREEYKDYVDVACLTKHTDARSWFSWWEDVYPSQEYTSWLIALSAAPSVPPVPLQMFGDYSDMSVSKTVLSAAKEITEYADRSLS